MIGTSTTELVPQAITGNPNAAQTILSSIASSTVTLLSLALTLTLVVIQLAMGQFSPRIVRALLSDRRTQLAIGLFAGTFVYSLLVLRRIDPQAPVVPGLSVLVAYVLMIASIGGLILYAHHTGQKLRVGRLIDVAGDEQRERIEEFYPADRAGPASARQEEDDERVIVGRKPGVVIGVNSEGLVAEAKAPGACWRWSRRWATSYP